ncbi:MAG: SPOR domain-containing protein [Gammaproteobacteria bacterium]
MELIDHDLDEIRKQRNLMQYGNDTSSKGVRHTKRHRRPSVFWSKIRRLSTLKIIAALILLGTVAVIAVVRIAGLIQSNPEPAQLTTDSILSAAQKNATSTDSEVSAISDAAQALEIPQPTASGQTSGEASIEGKPRQIPLGTNAIPKDTAEIDASATTSTASLRKPVRTASEAAASTIMGTNSATSKTTDIERQDHVTNKQNPDSVYKEDTWTINLVSSTNKADADHFAETARSKDIETVQQQVTVKGIQYWRVQITGFSTQEEAREAAGLAIQMLGLKDYWIMKH